jgi:uncharacterized protein YdeI (YjbR/CyaY-like superfamily)
MATKQKLSGLKRAINPMPARIRQLISSNNLMAAYKARPAYQRNDYLGWIKQAKFEETRTKRIKQMLEELKQGNRYMKMKWNPAR